MAPPPARPRHRLRDGRRQRVLTIYDCGAARKPPSARVIGNLVRVDAAHETGRQPTGYVVSLREEATPERQDEDHHVTRA